LHRGWLSPDGRSGHQWVPVGRSQKIPPRCVRSSARLYALSGSFAVHPRHRSSHRPRRIGTVRSWDACSHIWALLRWPGTHRSS